MPAKLAVETQLDDLIKGLTTIQGKADDLKKSFKDVGDTTGEALDDATKKSEKYFDRISKAGKQVVKNMKDDFKALFALNAIGDSLKISSQFKGVITDAFELSDSIRKFGTALGITGSDFDKFQSKITRGLGQIGMGSDVAARAMKGLLGTGVKGQDQLIGYSTAAGELASVSKTQGQEGDIAGALARVLRAQGQDPNNVKAMSELAKQVNRGYQATGKSPQELLKGMESMFTGMADDFRKRFSLTSMTQLAGAAQVAGPEATAFIEQYMKMSPMQRMGLDAQGMKGVIRSDGTIDTEKFGKFAKGIKSRVGSDPQLAAQTLGMSEDAAKGFLRLSDSLDRVKQAQEEIGKSTHELGDDYKNSMGFAESFRANINRVKSMLASPLASMTAGGSKLLSGASHSDLGAVAVAGGGLITAALLAGGGMKILSALLGKGIGGVAKGAAIEGISGREVQPVYVVNAAEIGVGGGGVMPAAGAGIMGGMTGWVKSLGLNAALLGGSSMGEIGAMGAGAIGMAGLGVAGAGAAGYGLGTGINSLTGNTGQFGGWLYDKIHGGGDSEMTHKVVVDVKTRDPGINAKVRANRGEEQ